MVLYLTLGVCALFAALLVWRYDMYEREPWYMLLLAAGLGAGAMWLMGHVEPFTLNLFGDPPRPDVVVAAVAATHEELARLAVVAGLALFVSRQFNDPMDGIIYGSIIGLGMAIDESIFYLSLWIEPGTFLPPQEVVRLFGHLVMGGITGFAVGMARMGMPRWPTVLAACLAISISLHFFWDWIALAAAGARRMAWWQTTLAIALMLSGIMVYGMLVVVGSSWSRRVFAPLSAKRLWGWPFTLLSRRDQPP